MPASITILPMRTEHLPAILRLGQEYFYPEISGPSLEACVSPIVCGFFGRVALSKSTLLGFSAVCSSPIKFDIGLICVHPEHLRQGIGTRLVQDVTRMMTRKSQRVTRTEVGEKNVRALLMFNKLGFQIVRVSREDPDEDRYTMAYVASPKIDSCLQQQPFNLPH
jgi:ribosomal protein S18 acetylase RimI-like enzyme